MFRWIDTLPDGPDEVQSQSNINKRNSTVSFLGYVTMQVNENWYNL